MRGSRVLGYAFTVFAAIAFIGFLSGATHQIATAIISGIAALVAFSRKTYMV